MWQMIGWEQYKEGPFAWQHNLYLLINIIRDSLIAVLSYVMVACNPRSFLQAYNFMLGTLFALAAHILWLSQHALLQEFQAAKFRLP